MNKHIKQTIGEVGGAQAGIQVLGYILSSCFSICGRIEGRMGFSFISSLLYAKIYHTEEGRKSSTSSFSVSSSWYNFPNLRFAASSSDMSEFSGSL